MNPTNQDPSGADEFRESLYEYYYPGTRQGIRLTDGHVDHLIALFQAEKAKLLREALAQRDQADQEAVLGIIGIVKDIDPNKFYVSDRNLYDEAIGANDLRKTLIPAINAFYEGRKESK